MAVYALTAAGAELARRLARALPGAKVFLPHRLAQAGEAGFSKISEALSENFPRFRGHVAIAATGIVVRALAPLLAHKALDPGVVVVDQAGQFAISLLAGHLGGANGLARQVAGLLGGQAVITTATDVAGLPSLEMEARSRGLGLENLPALAGVSLAVLEGRPVTVQDPEGWLWPWLAERWPGVFQLAAGPPALTEAGEPRVRVDWRAMPAAEGELVLRPPCLAVGLGCNRGTDQAEMAELLEKVLNSHGFSRASLARLASAEVKRDEPGLLELARGLNLPLEFYSPEELKQIKVPNPSTTVEKHVGTQSVCEAAAQLAARGGPLVVPKHKTPNVTVAVALLRPEASSR